MDEVIILPDEVFENLNEAVSDTEKAKENISELKEKTLTNQKEPSEKEKQSVEKKVKTPTNVPSALMTHLQSMGSFLLEEVGAVMSWMDKKITFFNPIKSFFKTLTRPAVAAYQGVKNFIKNSKFFQRMKKVLIIIGMAYLIFDGFRDAVNRTLFDTDGLETVWDYIKWGADKVWNGVKWAFNTTVWIGEKVIDYTGKLYKALSKFLPQFFGDVLQSVKEYFGEASGEFKSKEEEEQDYAVARVLRYDVASSSKSLMGGVGYAGKGLDKVSEAQNLKLRQQIIQQFAANKGAVASMVSRYGISSGKSVSKEYKAEINYINSVDGVDMDFTTEASTKKSMAMVTKKVRQSISGKINNSDLKSEMEKLSDVDFYEKLRESLIALRKGDTLTAEQEQLARIALDKASGQLSQNDDAINKALDDLTKFQDAVKVGESLRGGTVEKEQKKDEKGTGIADTIIDVVSIIEDATRVEKEKLEAQESHIYKKVNDSGAILEQFNKKHGDVFESAKKMFGTGGILNKVFEDIYRKLNEKKEGLAELWDSLAAKTKTDVQSTTNVKEEDQRELVADYSFSEVYSKDYDGVINGVARRMYVLEQYSYHIRNAVIDLDNAIRGSAENK